MKTKKLYECELCHTNYSEKEKAEQCEKCHQKVVAVADTRYLSYNLDQSGVPIKICIKFTNGKNIWFRRL